MCYFEDNRQCEEWALLRGDCPQGGLKVTGYITSASQYCVITGGSYSITGISGAEDEQGNCTFSDGVACDAWDYYNGICSPVGSEGIAPDELTIPELEEPTPTPVPETPTSEPTLPGPQLPEIQNFNVAPASIEPGQCVMVSWNTGGGTTHVRLLRDDAVLLDNAPQNNSVQDCPAQEDPTVIRYTLKAFNNVDQFDVREATVQVAPAPPQSVLVDMRVGKKL